MSKPKSPRKVEDNEAIAVLRNIRISPRKLNLVAQSIRGQEVGRALAQLSFNRRRVAQDVRKVLQSAVANAENNHSLDVDRLVVAQATVGQSFAMKRFSPRARGRAGRIEKFFSHLTIVVRQREEAA
jgi:large subunit ribosomal protein L22